MSRKNQKMRELLPIIEEKISSGKTHREIEQELEMKGNRPIHELLKRERGKEVKGIPKQRGSKPAVTFREYKYENKRLKMGNELLRDFLKACERK